MAIASGLLLAVVALAALSPFLRVRAVTWTGPLVLDDARCSALERAALGAPLYLVGEKTLAAQLQLADRETSVRVRRHFPSTLEVHVEPRRAVARLDAKTAVNAKGEVLRAAPQASGLPLLVGFERTKGGSRLEPEARHVLRAIAQLLDRPTLAPAEVRRDDDSLVLVLAESATRVRLDVSAADAQLEKLRIFEESLGGEPLPAAIDLRFGDQVVVRDGGGPRASRR